MKINASFPEWAADSLALACVFTWILVYPLHGPFLHQVFGPGAYIAGQVFGLGHGLGLLAFAFLPPSLVQKKAAVIGVGAVVFITGGVWTYISPTTSVHYWTGGFLGFISAYLVLAWIPRFLEPQSPVLKVGSAMVLANVLFGLSGLVLTQGLPAPFIKAAALVIGLGPFGAACLIAKKTPGTSPSDHLAAGRTRRQNIGAGPVLAIAAFAAAAYFTGGLWYRVVAPPLHLWWPESVGASSFLYAAAVLVFLVFAYRYSFSWLGTMSLCFLGIGVTVSIMGLDRVEVLITTLLFLSLGLGAMDLFYWLALRTLARFLGFLKTFGLGLGVSLFFLTVPGIALDAGFLTGQLSISPLVAVSGVCLLFAVVPLLVWFFHPLTFSEIDSRCAPEAPEDTGGLNTPDAPAVRAREETAASGRQPPPFWFSLTNQEKKVYELISRGHTDAEIAERLVITRHTVKFHTRNILKKAGATNRKELSAVDRQEKY
jgi:DNA-binding CsgD family transcriptional regulator